MIFELYTYTNSQLCITPVSLDKFIQQLENILTSENACERLPKKGQKDVKSFP